MTVNKSIPCHKKNYRAGRTAKVEYLVLHYVGAEGSAANNAKYYGTTAGIGASAHYFVGHASENAAVWQSVAEGDTAWHCGASKYVHPKCRNENSIGVELCCHKAADGSWYFDAGTVDAAAALCRDICERYNISAGNVLRHYDVTGKCCPEPFVRDKGAWEGFLARVFAPEGSDVPGGAAPASWAAEAWKRARATIGTDGKPILDGTRPVDGVTRQEVAVILDRLGLLKGGK